MRRQIVFFLFIPYVAMLSLFIAYTIVDWDSYEGRYNAGKVTNANVVRILLLIMVGYFLIIEGI